MKGDVKRLVLLALFIALVAVATMVINIPMVATQGFLNVGDTMIFVSALLLGPTAGLIAGGIGSALADILLGYAHWAPWTLVIKGLEGLIAGIIGYTAFKEGGRLNFQVLLALLISASWMVFGYYIAGGIMKGFAVSLTSVPGNMFQGFGSVILSIPLLLALKNNPLFK